MYSATVSSYCFGLRPIYHGGKAYETFYSKQRNYHNTVCYKYFPSWLGLRDFIHALLLAICLLLAPPTECATQRAMSNSKKSCTSSLTGYTRHTHTHTNKQDCIVLIAFYTGHCIWKVGYKRLVNIQY